MNRTGDADARVAKANPSESSLVTGGGITQCERCERPHAVLEILFVLSVCPVCTLLSTWLCVVDLCRGHNFVLDGLRAAALVVLRFIAVCCSRLLDYSRESTSLTYK